MNRIIEYHFQAGLIKSLFDKKLIDFGEMQSCLRMLKEQYADVLDGLRTVA